MTHSAETLQTPGEHADPYILRGFIWCAGCDLLMIPVLVTSGERHYDCPNRECPRSPVPAERVERLVWDHFAFLNQMSADEVPPEGRREALRQFLAKIWIGADVDQPYFDWRD